MLHLVILYRRVALPRHRIIYPANGAVLASHTMLTVASCSSECCMPSELELPMPVTLLFVQYFSKFKDNELLYAYIGALLWLLWKYLKKHPPPLWLVRWHSSVRLQ